MKCLQSVLLARRSKSSIARLRTRRERNFGHDATKVKSNNVLAKLVLIEIFDARCVICGGFLGAPRGTSESSIDHLIKSASATSIPIGTINLDHMRPASVDGPDHLLNYAPAHESCNKSRGNRPQTAEHEARFRDAWLGYESNGHTQVLGRMILTARDIELDPSCHVSMSGDTEQDRRAAAAEPADDQTALRFEVRPCSRGHNFHVYPTVGWSATLPIPSHSSYMASDAVTPLSSPASWKPSSPSTTRRNSEGPILTRPASFPVRGEAPTAAGASAAENAYVCAGAVSSARRRR